MNEQLKQFAAEAVKQSEQLTTSNEAKKRTAFAYINKKVLENNLKDISFEEIDNAIEEAWKGM
ncbi:phage holin, LLH family [Lactococcus garvieae]|uniref:Phage holin, LLH family n=1 Tax=Lactococcus garvieae TaxID=1363 RepID=A0AA46YRN3_9LACT|nr:phage holin, LLH family [Lactococcus garvieae]UYT10737.1 phage holin, LLH family [Lactococcus garvieae]UYT12779.1 phage holin, LLH family [Lactococcus garvieae]